MKKLIITGDKYKKLTFKKSKIVFQEEKESKIGF